MPLHISRIEIENFRNFKRLLIDPFPSTAVVVGENNVGKSNLLMAIRLLLDPDLPDSARSLREEDFYDSGQGPCLGKSIRIAVELKGFDEDEKAMAVLADCLISDEPAHARIEYVYELKSSIDLPDDELDDEIGDDPVENGSVIELFCGGAPGLRVVPLPASLGQLDETEAGDEHEPVRPAEPTMDAVANGAGDAVHVDRSSEHPNRLAVGGAVQQMVKRSLQVSHRAADLDNKMPARNGGDKSSETDQQQEQQDRQ